MRPKIVVHVTTVPMSLVFLAGQAEALRARGYDMIAISSYGDELDAFGREQEVRVVGIDMLRKISPLADLVALARLHRTLRIIRPDIVHGHTPKGGLLSMIAATLAGVPVRIYHLRGLPMLTARGPRRWLLRSTERVSCALAGQVICVSRSMRDIAVAEGVSADERAVVLGKGSGQGVDARTRFSPELVPDARGRVRRELGIDADALVVGFVGRIVREKGIDELVRAWERIERLVPRARLLLVGPFEPQDPLSPEARARIERGGTIVRVGFTRDVVPLYAAMDVVALPSWREGFPNVPLEAAAMERPVVSTRVPGCLDAVEDGVTGTLVPVRDADALADALLAYLQDDSLREQHGRSGRARVLDHFDRQSIIERIIDVYDRLTGVQQEAAAWGTR